MNKSIITLILLILMSSYGLAQGNWGDDREVRNQHKVGIKAGANLANVYDTEGEDFEARGKLGLVVGAFLSLPIGNYLGIQPEVLFSQKGFKSSGKVLGSGYDLDRTLNYLDIPLLLAIKPIPAVTLLVGPQVSFLLKRTDAFQNGNITIQQEQEFENENIRKNMLGITGGIDFNINHFVIGTRVGWDLQKNTGDGSPTTPRYKNTWVQATLGLRIF